MVQVRQLIDLVNGRLNAVAAFDQMGRPDFPSRAQIAALRKAGEMAAPEQLDLHDGKLQLDIPPQGLVVVELR